ncbi:polyprenyl synthetase family protein [Actinophytocola gossypii]|uniref:Polyprenyl synthetase family protein n=1 Tax=Actinophytocola gossypii TaxID=2812003 RepID=A0ABT2JKP8_9PSEU|nr:polyprenyl synthetase family protein [Actinophytocola gossypii]MCT2588303.1 polyprenyl synthetase family protein [Actinophytocola gossypii]
MGTALDTELHDALSEVEERLHKVLADAEFEFAAIGGRHLVTAGGKRIRPRLALLGARFGDPDDPRVLDAAVVVELVHVATLHHDDVMDGAQRRHGVPSANALWDNKLSVLLGDLVLARASELGADLDPRCLRLQSDTLVRLIRGQINEAAGAPAGGDQMAHAIEVMADKSASLIAMAVELGARVAGADETTCTALARYGEALGIAFQISDDVIDICTPATESGKVPGTDLREGVVTVPMLHALAAGDDAAARLRVILDTGPVTDDARHAEALELLRASPGMAAARADVHRYAQAARDELADLPPLPARDALAALADYVESRTA